MKNFLFALLAIISTNAFAAPETLSCRSLDKMPEFELTAIKVELPNTEEAMPGAWSSQTVELFWKSEDEQLNITDKVDMRLTKLGYSDVLNGAFDIGEDFGGINMSLIYDYDNNEIVAILDISTDGPVTMNIYRCKTK